MNDREPCEKCGKRTHCVHYPAYAWGFAARVKLAAQCIRTGIGLYSRAFDNCFEMGDGCALCTALDRMAQTDPALRAGMARVWDNAYSREQFARSIARLAHVPTDRLHIVARQQRDRPVAQPALLL